jgi:hypothetical protein
VIAWITYSSATTAKPSGCCANPCTTTELDHIVACSCNRRLASSGWRLLAHRRLVQCAGCRFSAVSITATASHPSTVLSRDEISAPDNGGTATVFAANRSNDQTFRLERTAEPVGSCRLIFRSMA